MCQEGYRGIEPRYSVWKTDALTFLAHIPYPHEGSNLAPQIKSLLHHHNALGVWSGSAKDKFW